MSEIPKISEAEWEVMKVVWSESYPCSANGIVEPLKNRANYFERRYKNTLIDEG